MKRKINYKKDLTKSIKPENLGEESVLTDVFVLVERIGYRKFQEHLDKIKLIEDER